MLNKVTKLPKSRFYVLGFDEKKYNLPSETQPTNTKWLQSFAVSCWFLKRNRKTFFEVFFQNTLYYKLR